MWNSTDYESPTHSTDHGRSAPFTIPDIRWQIPMDRLWVGVYPCGSNDAVWHPLCVAHIARARSTTLSCWHVLLPARYASAFPLAYSIIDHSSLLARRFLAARIDSGCALSPSPRPSRVSISLLLANRRAARPSSTVSCPFCFLITLSFHHTVGYRKPAQIVVAMTRRCAALMFTICL